MAYANACLRAIVIGSGLPNYEHGLGLAESPNLERLESVEDVDDAFHAFDGTRLEALNNAASFGACHAEPDRQRRLSPEQSGPARIGLCQPGEVSQRCPGRLSHDLSEDGPGECRRVCVSCTTSRLSSSNANRDADRRLSNGRLSNRW